MQTERITFLASRDQKAALDAFAREQGMSVGRIAREATSQFIAQPREGNEAEAELAALTDELEEALPGMRENCDAIVDSLRSLNERIEAARAGRAQRKAV